MMIALKFHHCMHIMPRLLSQLKSKSGTKVLLFVVSLIVLQIGLNFELQNVFLMTECRLAIEHQPDSSPASNNSESEPLPFGTLQQTTTTSLPQPLVSKNCSFDFDGHKPIIDEIQVLTMTNHNKSLPSVLCYIMCNSAYHERAEVIKSTWGRRCDGFFIASNSTDTSLGAVAIPMQYEHSYEKLWQKQRATIRYLYQNKIAQKYDWLLKADTDSYVIIENLKAHLADIGMDKFKPQLVGHDLFLPEKVRDEIGVTNNFDGYFFKVQQKQDRWKYAQGGAYAMNYIFLENMMTFIDTQKCLANESKSMYFGAWEDMATAFCVASTYPLSMPKSRDEHGRGLFHLFPPRDMEHPSRGLRKDMRTRHPEGPAFGGKECCSRHSISFHGFKKNWREAIYWMENQLYSCREKNT